ncbi:hypothetical protein ACTMTU_35615 [Streptomyces sp. OZ13]|uniref:hypothetical protein n=1 Tax=Streptomyces sp. OZ13 TaxID=3452210 RepID=UPI003F8CB2C2
MTGISVTADGQPLGVMLVCHGHIDSANLYTDGDKPSAESKTVGTWSRSEPVTGFTTWPLGVGGEGWSLDKPLRSLDPDRTYTLYGATRDNSWSAAHISFTAEDLAALAPGQLRYLAGDRDGADPDGYLTASIEDFRANACSDD